MAEKRPEHDPHGRELERRRALEEWEARKRAEAEHNESQEKQAELAAYLKRRGKAWMATTGEQPTLDDLATWRREYMGNIEAEYQQEQQKKMDKAMENYRF